MILGIFIAILFGINEDIFKNKISKDLSENTEIMQIDDLDARNAKIKTEENKSWRYYQRFHFHATGIGAMSLGALILFSLSLAPMMLRLIGSYMISIGGLLYPFVWLFAAIYGPVMGRHEAKEAFSLFGYMGGVFLLGLCLLLFSIIKYPHKLMSKN